MRNAMFTILLQQILSDSLIKKKIISDRLLLTITDGQKSNFSSRFKLELITIYHESKSSIS